MPTYAEKWEGMSTEERAEISEHIGQILTAFIEMKHDVRLNSDFKAWAAEAMLQMITKNHATIHYFKAFCEEEGLSTFETLKVCLERYKEAVAADQERKAKWKAEAENASKGETTQASDTDVSENL